MSAVEQAWRDACRRAGVPKVFPIGLRESEVLGWLLIDGPDNTASLARRSGPHKQPDMLRRLRKLDSLGFVVPRDVVVEVPRGASTTTSRALEWSLTRAGRELAGLLRNEARGAVSAAMRGREYWPVGDIRPGAVRGADARVAYWPVAA